MNKESIQDFLERGGQLKTIKAHDDRFASHTSRYHFKDSRPEEYLPRDIYFANLKKQRKNLKRTLEKKNRCQ